MDLHSTPPGRARLRAAVRYRRRGEAIPAVDALAAGKRRQAAMALGELAAETAAVRARRLAERPSAPVVVCEGEKAADAATGLLPGFVAVTSPNGSKSAGKADWSPLRGRAVTVGPTPTPPASNTPKQSPKCARAAGALVGGDRLAAGVASRSAGTRPMRWRKAGTVLARPSWSPPRKRPNERPRLAMTTKKIAGGRRRTPQRDTLIGLTDAANSGTTRIATLMRRSA